MMAVTETDPRTSYTRGREPMTREPDVALSMASMTALATNHAVQSHISSGDFQKF